MEYKLLCERLSEYFDTLPKYAYYKPDIFHNTYCYHILSDKVYNKEFCMRYGKLYVTWNVKKVFNEVDEYGFINILRGAKFLNKKLNEKPECKRITAKQAFEFLKRNDNFVKLLKQIYK